MATMPIDHRISDTPEGNMEDYGSGKSTGLDQTAAGKILTGFTPRT